jgi:hypothetical protein
MLVPNRAGWPEELIPVFERALTCEFASLTKAGAPITWPMNPYLGDDRRTIDISTGLTYSAKAERARRNPKVSILFSDPVGSGLEKMPHVLVQGMATVRDADLQAGADRYARLALGKYPSAYKTAPNFLLRRQQWYFTRIWILVTPLRILWWPGGDTESAPETWQAPEGTEAPPSDPAPKGPGLGRWQPDPPDWTDAAGSAIRYMGMPVLTVVDERGWPVPFRAKSVASDQDGFALQLGKGMPAIPSGPACLTFHLHSEVFTGQRNTSFTGEAEPREDGAFFKIHSVLPDFSLPENRFEMTLALMSAQRKLAPRLKREAERRGQAVPRVNLP